MKDNFIKLIYISFLLIAFFFLSSCASFKYSNKRKEERIQMTVNNKPGLIDLKNLQSQNIPGPRSRGIMIGDMISLAAEGIKLLIEADKKKYTSQYSYGLSDLYFYDRISDVSPFDISGMQFNGFDLLRTVPDKKDKKQDTALFISFKVITENPYEIFNNSMFRMKVDDFIMNYGKAKIPAFRWYMPWTIFYKNRTNINLDIKITFTASWAGVNSDINSKQEIGNLYLELRDIPLGDTEKFEAYKKGIIGMPVYGSSFIVPRSYGTYLTERKEFEPAYGQGIYDILVEITESGKDHFVTKIVQDNSGKIVEEVKSTLINQLH